MVIAYHLIATAYGWWLPNDLRGSMSKSVRSDLIKELGELHYGRKRVQPNSKSIHDFYKQAEFMLQRELLEFREAEREIIAQSFEETIRRENYTCYGFVLMKDHTHLCIRKHKHLAEEMILTFQEYSRRALIESGLRTKDHPVWGGPGWKVFLDEPDDVWRTIRYIGDNPIKMGEPRQVYPFVTLYDDWPFHKSPRNRKR